VYREDFSQKSALYISFELCGTDFPECFFSKKQQLCHTYTSPRQGVEAIAASLLQLARRDLSFSLHPQHPPYPSHQHFPGLTESMALTPPYGSCHQQADFVFVWCGAPHSRSRQFFFFLAPRSRITMARGTNRLLYRLPLRWICGCCLHQPRCGLHLLKDYLGGSRRWGVGQTVNMHVSSSSYVTCVYPPPYRSRHSGVGQTVNIHTHTHIYTNTHIHTYKWRYTYICTGVHIYMCVWEAALGRGTHGTNS